jgi:hypothetical protein
MGGLSELPGLSNANIEHGRSSDAGIIPELSKFVEHKNHDHKKKNPNNDGKGNDQKDKDDSDGGKKKKPTSLEDKNQEKKNKTTNSALPSDLKELYKFFTKASSKHYSDLEKIFEASMQKVQDIKVPKVSIDTLDVSENKKFSRINFGVIEAEINAFVKQYYAIMNSGILDKKAEIVKYIQTRLIPILENNANDSSLPIDARNSCSQVLDVVRAVEEAFSNPDVSTNQLYKKLFQSLENFNNRVVQIGERHFIKRIIITFVGCFAQMLGLVTYHETKYKTDVVITECINLLKILQNKNLTLEEKAEIWKRISHLTRFLAITVKRTIETYFSAEQQEQLATYLRQVAVYAENMSAKIMSRDTSRSEDLTSTISRLLTLTGFDKVKNVGLKYNQDVVLTKALREQLEPKYHQHINAFINIILNNSIADMSNALAEYAEDNPLIKGKLEDINKSLLLVRKGIHHSVNENLMKANNKEGAKKLIQFFHSVFDSQADPSEIVSESQKILDESFRNIVPTVSNIIKEEPSDGTVDNLGVILKNNLSTVIDQMKSRIPKAPDISPAMIKLYNNAIEQNNSIIVSGSEKKNFSDITNIYTTAKMPNDAQVELEDYEKRRQEELKKIELMKQEYMGQIDYILLSLKLSIKLIQEGRLNADSLKDVVQKIFDGALKNIFPDMEKDYERKEEYQKQGKEGAINDFEKFAKMLKRDSCSDHACEHGLHNHGHRHGHNHGHAHGHDHSIHCGK